MRPDRTVLAFDTAREHCAAILVSEGEPRGCVTEFMKRGQAERLFPMLEDFLESRHISWSDLAAVGVGTGPGNFTGTRIAVSATRGLAMALGVPAIGTSRFEAIAFFAHESGTVGGGHRILCSVDLQFNQVATQEFMAAPIPNAVSAPITRDPGEFRVETVGAGPTAAEVSGGVPLFRERAGDVTGFLAALGVLTWRKLVSGDAQQRPLPVYLRPPVALPARRLTARSCQSG